MAPQKPQKRSAPHAGLPGPRKQTGGSAGAWTSTMGKRAIAFPKVVGRKRTAEYRKLLAKSSAFAVPEGRAPAPTSPKTHETRPPGRDHPNAASARKIKA